jgi:hypothetical protein
MERYNRFHLLHLIIHFPACLPYSNEAPYLGTPVLRSIFRPVYPLAITVVMYTLLCALGVVGNLVVVCAIFRRRIGRNRRCQVKKEGRAISIVRGITIAMLMHAIPW